MQTRDVVGLALVALRQRKLRTALAILGVAVFGGIYYVVVTAAEVMGFGTSAKGLAAFGSSPSLLGHLGSSYVGSWVGDVITAGTTVSAFGCCLACTVGAARLIYAMSRDSHVYPYPAGDGYWFPIVAGGWLVAAVIGVLLAPCTGRRLGPR